MTPIEMPVRRHQAVGHRPREQPGAIEHYTQLKSVYVELALSRRLIGVKRAPALGVGGP